MPYAQIGLIEQAREAMEGIQETNPEALRTAQDMVARDVLTGAADVLAQPEYKGGVDGALVHHLGQNAFGNEEVTGRYIGLVARIYGQKVKNLEEPGERAVPVLFVFGKDNPDRGMMSHTSVLVNIAPGGPVAFWSNRSRNGVEVYEAADENSTVDTSRLLIMGDTTVIDGDITKTDGWFGVPKTQGGYLLRKSSEVSHGSKDGSEETKVEDLLIEGQPTILVGWGEIKEALVKRITNPGSGNRLGQALQIKEFLDAGGNLAALEQEEPELRKVLAQAVALHNSIGRLAADS